MKDTFNGVVLPLAFIGGILFIVANAPAMARASSSSLRGLPNPRRLTTSQEAERDSYESAQQSKNKDQAKKALLALKGMDIKSRLDRPKGRSKRSRRRAKGLTDLMIVKAFFEE